MTVAVPTTDIVHPALYARQEMAIEWRVSLPFGDVPCATDPILSAHLVRLLASGNAKDEISAQIESARRVPSVNAPAPTAEVQGRARDVLRLAQRRGIQASDVVEHPDGGLSLHFRKGGNTRYARMSIYNEGAANVVLAGDGSMPIGMDIDSDDDFGDALDEVAAHIN